MIKYCRFFAEGAFVTGDPELKISWNDSEEVDVEIAGELKQ